MMTSCGEEKLRQLTHLMVLMEKEVRDRKEEEEEEVGEEEGGGGRRGRSLLNNCKIARMVRRRNGRGKGELPQKYSSNSYIPFT